MHAKTLFASALLAASMVLPAQAEERITANLFGNKLTVHIATTRPPSYSVREYRGAKPQGRHMWIRGYWNYNGHQWVWIRGRWEASQNNRVWIHPTYQRERGIIIYYPGRWSDQPLTYSEEYDRHRRNRGGFNYRYDKRK